MKSKALAVLAMVSFLAISTGCEDRYQEGFNAGYDQGYDEGYVDGDADGYERARQYFQTQDYASGFAAGQAAGIQTGYAQGYNVGKTDGIAIGRQQGYNTGYDDGYDDGYVDGDADGYADGYDDGYDDGYADGADPAAITAAYNNGYNDGYDDGDADGFADGYDIGYDDGFGDGYDIGYDDGFDDGYDIGFDDGWDAALGLSVGPLKTNSVNKRNNLLSKVHNDLVNYSKIKAPKLTARGIEANGRLIFEETSMTSKDLEKRAAATEKYLVSEMGKQISAKFGLSQERSFKVAKIANHWRKFSTTRAVTADDADAFSEELIGANLKEVEAAVKSSMRGEASELNSLLEKAAAQNQTSPEKITLIMNKLFF
jgi:flagellar biosynthesis/type III secretory pathway protein FliH